MKRVLLTIAVALVVPSILAAAPITVGVYFEGGLTCVPPAGPGVPFEMALYMVQSEAQISALEYSLVLPLDPELFSIQSWTLPPYGKAELGLHPMSGHSITYWPPLSGYPDGYDLLVTYECVTFGVCYVNMVNYEIVVSAHPDTGYLRGTYVGGEKVDLVGLTTFLCPEGVATEEESWGAIKSMYR